MTIREIIWLEDVVEKLVWKQEVIPREVEEALFGKCRIFRIIAEAVKNIPSSVRNRYPDVAWKEAAAK